MAGVAVQPATCRDPHEKPMEDRTVSHGQQTKLISWLAVELILEPTMPILGGCACNVTYVGGKDMSHFTIHTETLVAESPGGCTLTINVRGLVWWIPTYCIRK